MPRTRVPVPTPGSNAQHRPLGDPTTWWAAWSQVAPASAPPDKDNGTPGWGRLAPHLVALIIGHVADHRGSAGQEQHVGEEKRSHSRGRGRGQGRHSRREDRHCNVVPPPASLSWCGNFCRGGAGVSLETTDNKQTTIKSQQWVVFNKGSQCHAPTTPPPKDKICHWDWGEGVAGFNMVQKGRAGDAIIMRWMVTMMMAMMMARGGSREKSINDSIS
jgi:hypothetical protein